jgi:predicted DCC family thiol-disulfide oxidoreductase YuxK
MNQDDVLTRGPRAREDVTGSFDVEVFHDGQCPLCRREMLMLARLDRRRRIRFTDIADPDFDPRAAGITGEALMARIHGRLPDGTLIEGVEVFRRLYAAVGFGRLVALTRIPGISHLLTLAYRLFARNRLRLTGRCGERGCPTHPRQESSGG